MTMRLASLLAETDEGSSEEPVGGEGGVKEGVCLFTLTKVGNFSSST
jgi:hypothetical protein